MGPEDGCAAVCLECSKGSLVVRMACVPLESGAKIHRALVLYCELATVMPWMVRGLGRWRDRLVQLIEWGTWVALWWAYVLIPVLFFTPETSGNRLFDFPDEPRFSGQHQDMEA